MNDRIQEVEAEVEIQRCSSSSLAHGSSVGSSERTRTSMRCTKAARSCTCSCTCTTRRSTFIGRTICSSCSCDECRCNTWYDTSPWRVEVSGHQSDVIWSDVSDGSATTARRHARPNHEQVLEAGSHQLCHSIAAAYELCDARLQPHTAAAWHLLLQVPRVVVLGEQARAAVTTRATTSSSRPGTSIRSSIHSFGPMLTLWLRQQRAASGVTLPADRTKCPLCGDTRVNPALLPASGYAFCYPCIHNHVEQHGCCPVTLAPASVDTIRKLYES